MFCSSCGNQMMDQADVCPKCGVVPKNVATAKSGTVGGRTIVYSYILAIVLPLFGFIAGIYLLCKKQAGHGVACIVISIIAACLINLAMFALE